MMPFLRILLVCCLGGGSALAAELRLGMIGLDTSHAVVFTRLLNDPQNKDHVPGARVVAAYKAMSSDIENSYSRVDKHAEQLQNDFGVKLYGSIEEMVKHVDGVLIESVDGRVHLAQARPVILAGKPLFIDKPLAASLKDGLAIFALAKKHRVPVFSSSSLRFGKNTLAVRDGALGKVSRVETGSPASLEPTHPDLFWYGIHGVESLFTAMGTGIESVTRKSAVGEPIVVEGRWKGGRVGVYRERKGYGGQAVGEKGEMEVGKYDGYAPLVRAIVEFMKTGVSPVPEQETIEILAFMEADALSKARGGRTVKVAEVLKQAGWKK